MGVQFLVKLPHSETPPLHLSHLSGTGDSDGRFARIDSRESFAIETPIFIARQANSHESLEFPIRANHPIHANRANRFARITPLSQPPKLTRSDFFLQKSGFTKLRLVGAVSCIFLGKSTDRRNLVTSWGWEVGVRNCR